MLVELEKTRCAVCGLNNQNLADLEHMDGKSLINFVVFYDQILLEYIHTSDIEGLNSLVLKYSSKTHVYRYLVYV